VTPFGYLGANDTVSEWSRYIHGRFSLATMAGGTLHDPFPQSQSLLASKQILACFFSFLFLLV